MLVLYFFAVDDHDSVKVVLLTSPRSRGYEYLQAMDGTVVDGRKIFHTEFGRFADALKFALSLN